MTSLHVSTYLSHLSWAASITLRNWTLFFFLFSKVYIYASYSKHLSSFNKQSQIFDVLVGKTSFYFQIYLTNVKLMQQNIAQKVCTQKIGKCYLVFKNINHLWQPSWVQRELCSVNKPDTARLTLHDGIGRVRSVRVCIK